ncbi:TadE/TadG family type IV pilus assembly protein [Fodinicola feengrottensis]|uniref:TadE/TadG family type IV pilus assembly protein n=1 Tax=Fodinicola feengrottensis TaxID=435914 RepID=UPI0013D438EB|nr:TadE/TadG family type IV pilus assembly protein [Fodinicola feengrottensis]
MATQPAQLRAHHAGKDGSSSEDGSAAAEMAVLMLVFVVVLLGAVLAVGRAGSAGHVVQSAAQAAAPAATLTRTVSAARGQATALADQTLNQRGKLCASRQVQVDLANFRPGGTVRVRISCTIQLADLSLPGVPGTATFQASSVSGVDVFRTVG